MDICQEDGIRRRSMNYGASEVGHREDVYCWIVIGITPVSCAFGGDIALRRL